MEKILIVDDEPAIIKLAQIYLQKEGYATHSTGNGIEALKMISTGSPDLMILDIMLPGKDGLEVCRQLRSEGNWIPILMLTARDDDIDKIVGLEMGADDYLTKPFNPKEMVARVKALLRRRKQNLNSSENKFLEAGDITINESGREVMVNGSKIDLRMQEFDLLLTLVNNQGVVLTRNQLLNMAWGYDFYGQSRTVDVHIAQLRKKMTGSRIRIETVSGIGYKLVI